MTEEIAAIIYQPRCDKCGNVIAEQVKYKILPYMGKFPSVLTDCKITPSQCPFCGAYFSKIIIEHIPIEEGDGKPKDGGV